MDYVLAHCQGHVTMDDRKNWLELNLNNDEQALVEEAAKLYKATYLDTIDNVFKIANAIGILQRRHYGSGVQGGFGDALVQYGFTNRDGSPMDKGIRSNLKALLDNEKDVRAWWLKVPERKKRDWLSARAIHRHWLKFKQPKDPNAPKKPTPLQEERATNVTLQQELHATRERLRTADGGNLFDLDHDTVEHVGTVIGARWRSTPSRIRRLIEVLSEQAKEADAAVKAARPLGGLPGRRTRHGRVVK